MFNLARSTGKRLLGRNPALYRIGQRLYTRVRLASDRRIFSRRYPAAAYIEYSDAEIAGFLDDGYHSQYGQDWYLFNKVFRGKTHGTFVDIGGNDPIELSNSYFLERAGWHGIAFDPLARAAQLWARHRQADFHHVAISNKEETRNFIEIDTHDGWEHALSGFDGFVREEDKARYGFRKYPIKSMPLDRFIPRDRHIDLIMIDVEGAENIVVDGIDLDRVKADYIMIENVSSVGGGEDVRRKILSSGYELICRIGGADDLFRKIGI